MRRHLALLLLLCFPIVLGACAELDEPNSRDDLATTEQATITPPLHLRVGWDNRAQEVVAVLRQDPGDRARSAVLLMGTGRASWGSGECFAGGRCTSLENVREQRVNVRFDGDLARAEARFSPRETRRRAGYVCFQAFTRDHESLVECTMIPRTRPEPVAPDKADGATEAQCNFHSGSPETCVGVPGCATGIFDSCFRAESSCEEHMTDRTCFDADCVWHGGTCYERSDTRCSDNPNPAACALTSLSCFWFINECITAPSGTEVPAMCPVLDELGCELADGCFWNGASCVVAQCPDFTDAASCQAADSCVWVESLDRCFDSTPETCSGAWDETSCDAVYFDGWGFRDNNCWWIDDTCIEPPTYCTWEYTQEACLANLNGCSWNADWAECTW